VTGTCTDETRRAARTGPGRFSTVAAALGATHPVDQGIGVVVKRVSDTRVGPCDRCFSCSWEQLA